MSLSPESESRGPDKPAGVLVDICGAAALLGLTPWQVRGLVTNKELPVIEVGRKFYFRRTVLLRWAEKAEAKRA